MQHQYMNLKRMMVMAFAGIFFLSCSLSRKTAQKSGGQQVSSLTVVKPTDTTKKSLKLYKDLITDKAITDDGLFKVHRVDDRYYFEITNTLFNKDILIVNRVSKAAAGIKPDRGRMGYAGDCIGENVMHIEKGPEQKVFFKRMSFLDITGDSSDNGMSRSIHNSSLQPIVASFDIKAYSPDSAGVVIDVTDYIKGDNDVFFFSSRIKKIYELGGMMADRSYISNIHSYPLNTEIRTVKTYTSGNESLILSGNSILTYELNTSIVLLPEKPMKYRGADERVGYFARGYRSFDASDGVEVNFKVTRWRLEPKEEDIEKYKRGELVEPKKPIVFYIDPATPKKWVPYLIEGVNAWQSAFEKAGFKNAIHALEAPKDDSTWSLEDARHNAIVYMASDFPNAMGPHVSDPRTGEILESHIYWYHNVLQILHDWYMVQAGPNDPRARKMQFDDSLMGQLIKYVCTHEVGHTLGLQHNFRASTTIPVDSLRSKSYVAKNSHTPSIMDYARFNYVAQPEDSIDVKDLIPRIGVYDDWAIEWGYKWLPDFKTEDEEKSYLNKWVIKKLDEDKRLSFSDALRDSWSKIEDLGDDAVKASNYGIKNLQRVMANIKDWTKAPNGTYEELSRLQRSVVSQYSNYISHVVDDIGAIYWTPKKVEQHQPVYEFSTKEKQRASVQFLQDQLFNTPIWLDNKELFPYVGWAGIIWIYKLQEFWIHQLILPQVFLKMYSNENYMPAIKAYSFEAFLTDMESCILKELNNHDPIELNRRNVQKIYVFKLIKFMDQKEGDFGLMDACTVVENHMQKLYATINKAIPLYKDQISVAHLKDLRERLKKGLAAQSGNNLEMLKKSVRAFNFQPVDVFNMPSNERVDFMHQHDNWGCWDSWNKPVADWMKKD